MDRENKVQSNFKGRKISDHETIDVSLTFPGSPFTNNFLPADSLVQLEQQKDFSSLDNEDNCIRQTIFCNNKMTKYNQIKTFLLLQCLQELSPVKMSHANVTVIHSIIAVKA